MFLGLLTNRQGHLYLLPVCVTGICCQGLPSTQYVYTNPLSEPYPAKAQAVAEGQLQTLGPAPQRGVRHKPCLLKTQYRLQCANEIGKQTSRPTIKKARTTTGKPKYVRLRNGAENSLAQATTSVNTPTSPMRGPADPSSRCKLCSSTMGFRLSGISAIARQHNKSRRASQPNQYHMPHSTPQHTGQTAQAAGTSCEPDAASGTATGQCNAMPEIPDPSMHDACVMSTAQDASPHFTSG